MIGVIVSGEHTHESHAVAFYDVNESIDVVGGIDQDAFTSCPIADCIGEVHHLMRQIVIRCEVTPREQLAKIQSIVVHIDEPTRAYP